MGMHCLKALPNLICIADIEQCFVLYDSVVVRVFCVLSVHFDYMCVYCRAETNTTDIRIFVCFAIFEHNFYYSTICLQPCGFEHAYFIYHLELGFK